MAKASFSGAVGSSLRKSHLRRLVLRVSSETSGVTWAGKFQFRRTVGVALSSEASGNPYPSRLKQSSISSASARIAEFANAGGIITVWEGESI